MRNYFALPQMNPGGGINFQPVQNALAQVGEQNNINARNALVQREMEATQARQAKMDARQSQMDQRAVADRLGKMAMAGQQLTDPNEQQALLGRILSEHPGADSLGPEYKNPATAFKLIASEAGLYNDPRESQLMDLKLAQAKKDLASTKDNLITINGKLVNKTTGAVVGDYSTPDPIQQLLAQRFQSMGAGSPNGASAPQGTPSAAPTGPASVKPMSFQGQPVGPEGGANPLLQLIDDRQGGAQAPVAPQPSAQQQDIVDTPLGPMPRSEARTLAGQMMSSPKYATLGKALWEATGGDGPSISKPVEADMDKATMSAANTLARLADISKKFDPKFQEIPNRLKLKGASWGASLGIKLDPQTQGELEKFAEFRAAGFNNFNQLLKELSGTAVSAQELERQKLVQPDPGSTLVDGDDPITFKSKLEAGQRFARAAIARMNFLKKNNLTFNKDTAEQFLALEDVPAVIDRRGAEIEADLKKQFPNADPTSIERQAEQLVRKEFGI